MLITRGMGVDSTSSTGPCVPTYIQEPGVFAYDVGASSISSEESGPSVLAETGDSKPVLVPFTKPTGITAVDTTLRPSISGKKDACDS